MTPHSTSSDQPTVSVGDWGPCRLRFAPSWRPWVTRQPLLAKPIHRWFTFPHSFTSELVNQLIDQWQLTDDDCIVDPFVGAGTTILAAKERNVPATGYDLSPLATFVSRVKCSNHANIDELKAATSTFLERARCVRVVPTPSPQAPDLLRRALPGRLLPTFAAYKLLIEQLPVRQSARDFVMLGMLATIQRYSRARANGGWLRWTANPSRSTSIRSAMASRLDQMLSDVAELNAPTAARWDVAVADARDLPDPDGTFTALITSPPYPNRHDYTRVFGVELMFGFLDHDGTRDLRHQTIESHPEAKPTRPDHDDLVLPVELKETLRLIRDRVRDPRIPRMLDGYFEDIHICLGEASRVCGPGARLAFVVGNVQYAGVPVLVDEAVAAIGTRLGLRCEGLTVARYRGNSAQQMGRHGRHPSRETVIQFQKTE